MTQSEKHFNVHGGNVLEFRAELVLQEVQVVLGGVVESHDAPQELMRVRLQGFQLHLHPIAGV